MCPARACKDRDSSTAEDLELVTVRCVVVYVLYSVERVWSKQDVLDDECALERVERSGEGRAPEQCCGKGKRV